VNACPGSREAFAPGENASFSSQEAFARGVKWSCVDFE
jgi:hypothetical protein